MMLPAIIYMAISSCILAGVYVAVQLVKNFRNLRNN